MKTPTIRDLLNRREWPGYLGGLRAERFKSGVPTHIRHGETWYRLPRRYRKLITRAYLESPFTVTAQISRAIWMDNTPNVSLTVDNLVEWLGH